MNNNTLSAVIESFASLSDSFMRILKVNGELREIIDDQKKQIAELTAYINNHIEKKGV